MAVLIQEIAGHRYGRYYYPAISGVAQSHNYYPVFQMKRRTEWRPSPWDSASRWWREEKPCASAPATRRCCRSSGLPPR